MSVRLKTPARKKISFHFNFKFQSQDVLLQNMERVKGGKYLSIELIILLLKLKYIIHSLFNHYKLFTNYNKIPNRSNMIEGLKMFSNILGTVKWYKILPKDNITFIWQDKMFI